MKKDCPEQSGSGSTGIALWISAALVGLVFLLYGQVICHDFVSFDDPQYVLDNPYVSRGFTGTGIRWAFTGWHAYNWHPLTWMSHMLDCQLFGLKPAWHHLTNVGLHAANSVLLFVALRYMTRAVWPCALTAALFALHPLHVESVAWVAERKDVLSTLFWIFVILAYAWYAKGPAAGRYLLVLALLALGLMAKPMLVTLPLVLLLLDIWPLGRWRSFDPKGASETTDSLQRKAKPASLSFAPRPWHRLLLEKMPLLCLSMVSAAITVLAQKSGGAVTSFGLIPLSLRLSNAMVAYVGYLWKAIWPVNLSCFYPHPAVVSPDAAGNLIGCAIAATFLVATITILVLFQSRIRPYLAIGWFWYLGTLVPVIGLMQVGSQAMADRYTYVPLIGFFIMLSWGLRDVVALWPRTRPVLFTAAAAALVGCMVVAWIQVGTWRNSRTLFEQALQATSDNYLAHNHLGALFEREGNLASAAAQFERALRIRPDYAKASNNLGVVFERQGNLVLAAAQYERAIQIEPDFADAHHNLGLLFEKQGSLASAAAHFERAIQIEPDHANARYSLGNILMKQGNLVLAASQFERAIQIKPDYADAHNNLGIVFERQGNLASAAAQFERAIQIKPDYADAHNNLGVVFTRQGNLASAVAQYERALRIEPNYAKACYNLGVVFERQGDLASAAAWHERAIQIKPDYAEAHYNLGAVFERQGNLASAATQYQRVLRIRPDAKSARVGLERVRAQLQE